MTSSAERIVSAGTRSRSHLTPHASVSIVLGVAPTLQRALAALHSFRLCVAALTLPADRQATAPADRFHFGLRLHALWHGFIRPLRIQRLPRISQRALPEMALENIGDIGVARRIPAVVDTDEPFSFQRHVAIIKPDRQRAEARFLWHMLRSKTVFDKAWASTTGSAQPTIPLRAIRVLPVPLPPVAE